MGGAGGIPNLIKEINDLIFKGWQPFGDLCYTSGTFILTQAMVKLEGDSSMIKEYNVIDMTDDPLEFIEKVNDFIFKG